MVLQQADLRTTRDSGRVGQALDRVRIAAEDPENTMPYLMEADSSYAMPGGIMQVMKEVFGVPDGPMMI
jgi:methylmalonyl-CoA mutase N-terminal domain/subunit